MTSYLPSLTALRVRQVGSVVYPPGATLPLRQLPDFEFVWIIDGTSFAYFDEQRIEAPPDSVLLRRPQMTDRYDWAADQRTVHAFIHFDADLSRRGWTATRSWPLQRQAGDQDLLLALFRFILSQHHLPEPLRSSLLTPALELMLRAFVLGRHQLAPEPQAPMPPPVEKAMKHIQQTMLRGQPRPINLAELAKAAHVTPEHLCRLFRKSLRRGPLECVRLARLQFAANLLQRTAMSVKEIADAAGFANPYHFSRVFRQAYEVSPSEYQRRVANRQPVKVHTLFGNLPLEVS